MKNTYEIRGDTVVIFLPVSDGTVIETYIDYDDFERVSSYANRWYASRNNVNYPYYVYGTVSYLPEGAKRKVSKNISLHRFIMNFPEGLVVDHIDENTLDNRKRNLQAITNSENVKKQQWRNKPRRKKFDTRELRWVNGQMRYSDIKIMRREAEKLGMTLEYWVSMVLSERIGVIPWYKEIEKYGAVISDKGDENGPSS